MSDSKAGQLVWQDLTVDNAGEVKDFYAEVLGWQSQGVSMGEYEDFAMKAGGKDVAGICHAKGANAGLPAQWLLYFTVDDLDQALKAVTDGGGELIGDIRTYGGSARYVVIKDPAGAACALYEDNSQ